MPNYGSDASNPNYVESVASLKRKTKEDIRIDSLIPSAVLENAENADGSPNIKTLLEHYYKFMNMDEFIYTATETFTDLVAPSTTFFEQGSGLPLGKAVFRVSDPNNDNNEFFQTNSAMELKFGSTVIPLTNNSVPVISNGNELPGSLRTSPVSTGKTVTIDAIPREFINKNITLTTPITYWVGPGPSYILNAIEEAMNIDYNDEVYLSAMQKEIASAIPKNLTSVEKRTLYKNIVELYKLKGSSDSIEIFFRLLFDEEAEVEFPWDKTLIPSEGNWDAGLGRYLDHKGFLSDNIKLQDSFFYQKFSYNIKTGKNLSDWKHAFDRLIHPAGFIFFGEVLILTQLTRAALGDNSRISSIVLGNGEVQVPGNPGQQYRILNVYPRTNRKTLSSMPGEQPGVIGAEDLPLLVEMFASTFLPNIVSRIDKTARFSVTLNSNGTIGGINIVDGGFGYPSAPTLTITGDNGSGAQASCTIDENGIVVSVSVDQAGSSYTTASCQAAGNPDAGKVKTIFLSNLADKEYSVKPTLVFDDPTSVDADGNPLATNVTAQGTVILDGNINNTSGKITGVQMDIFGNGYVVDPRIRIGSATSGEIRAKEVKEIAIIMLNHVANIDPSSNGFRTLVDNNYFNRKENSYYTIKKFRDGYPISFYGDKTIESRSESDINRYNVKTIINQE